MTARTRRYAGLLQLKGESFVTHANVKLASRMAARGRVCVFLKPGTDARLTGTHNLIHQSHKTKVVKTHAKSTNVEHYMCPKEHISSMSQRRATFSQRSVLQAPLPNSTGFDVKWFGLAIIMDDKMKNVNSTG